MKKVYTTGQVAKICNVANRTVMRWFNVGLLRGYRIPGSQDRRIPREHLVRFLKEHGMPLDGLEEGLRKVLVVSNEPALADHLRGFLPLSRDYKILEATNGSEAGAEAQAGRPQVAVVDLVIGRSEGIAVAGTLRKRFTEILIVALAGEDESDMDGLLKQGFGMICQKPLNLAVLAASIRKAFEGDD